MDRGKETVSLPRLLNLRIVRGKGNACTSDWCSCFCYDSGLESELQDMRRICVMGPDFPTRIQSHLLSRALLSTPTSCLTRI